MVVTPSAARLTHSLRDIGYDFPAAVADIVDNSVAAGAARVEIDIEFTSPDRLQEYANRKGVEVTGASSLVVRGDDWWTAWSDFFF